jgi:hypothetical protein
MKGRVRTRPKYALPQIGTESARSLLYLWQPLAEEFDAILDFAKLAIQDAAIFGVVCPLDAAAGVARVKLQSLDLGDDFRLWIVNLAHVLAPVILDP